MYTDTDTWKKENKNANTDTWKEENKTKVQELKERIELLEKTFQAYPCK